MMLGNVAPAPLSCTCAAAGAAAQSSAARAMVRVVFTGSSSVWVELEHELRLEQRLIDSVSGALGLQTIEVGEQAHVWRQLVRRTGDDPGIAVIGDVGVGIEHVHTADERDLAGLGEVIDAEGADDAPSDRPILHRDELTRERVLRRLVRQHPQVPVAVGPAVGFADPGVSRHPQAADAAVVVSGLDAHGDTGLDVLTEVAGAARVTFPVHDYELAVYPLTVPMAVDSHTDVRRRHGAWSADRVAIHGDGALHAVVPKGLLEIDPRCVNH